MEKVKYTCAAGHSVYVPKRPSVTGYGGMGYTGGCSYCENIISSHNWRETYGYKNSYTHNGQYYGGGGGGGGGY